MSEGQLREDIIHWLRDHAGGHSSARPRRDLLVHLCALGHWPTPNDTADRALRKFKEGMPEVGSNGRGYFLIQTAEDRRVAERGLHSKAMAELHREKQIRDTAPAGQMTLFGGEQ